jgi:polyisoprenyl-teichoic acid--peptidoglycan teichoic acid transferase
MGKKKLKIYIFAAVLAILGISSYIAMKYYVYGEVYTSRPEILAGSDLDKIRQQHEEKIYKPEKEANQRPYSVLLVGLDSKTMDSGRSDTLMVALVDQKKKKYHFYRYPVIPVFKLQVVI